MKLYSITSSLHNEISETTSNEPFVNGIETAMGRRFEHCAGLGGYSTDDSLLYVRTGGSEGIFKAFFAGDGKLVIPGSGPVRMLASGQSNSLAASMEILSYLRLNGYEGEIIHGTPEEVAAAVKNGKAGRSGSLLMPLGFDGILSGRRYGVVGQPSDWLISSSVDYSKVRSKLGCELVDIDIDELVSLVREGSFGKPAALKELNTPKFGARLTSEDLDVAWKIYGALKHIVDKYSLDGLTLRCFDLLTSVGNTGCLSLAILNSEGCIATCEGDIPAMLTMAVARELTGKSSFQVNLSRVEDGKMLFAHCTIPLDMVRDYCYDTHFESGIGVGIHGELEENVPATIFKIGADMEHCFIREITLLRNQYENNLCRTQIWVEGRDVKEYMFTEPLGNHHVIVPGSIDVIR